MPFTGNAKNTMLDAISKKTAPGIAAEFVGLLSENTPKSGVTGVFSTGVFSLTSHGFSENDLVVLSAMTGGTGLVAGRPYFVIAEGLTANAFKLAMRPGGAAVAFTSELTAATVAKLVEVAGGSPAYARVATKFGAATGGANDDAEAHALNVPAGTTVAYVGFWSAATVGTLIAIAAVIAETFAGQGTYNVTDAKFDINGIA